MSYHPKFIITWLWIVLDIVLVLGGVVLILYGFGKWHETNFQFEAWSTGGLFVGRSYVLMIVLGIAFLFYGWADFKIFRKNKKGP